ncbi:hypothetical protein LJR232_005019 [Aquipseudomonas alcaligenes]
MLSTGCIRSHEQQVAMLGSAVGIDPERFPRRYELAKARGELKELERAERERTKQEKRAEEDRSLVAEVRKLAKSYHNAEVARLLGIERKRLARLAEEYGICFPDGRTGQLLIKHEVHAEKLKAYLAIGLTKHEARRASGLSFGMFKRVCARFDINFPH